MTEPTDDENNVVRVDFGAAREAPTAAQHAQAAEERKDKLKTFSELIARGMVMITIDARAGGVMVPMRFGKDAQLALNFSHRFGRPDFSYDERGVRCTLTFQGEPFFCDVPWGAVYSMRSNVDGQVLLWPDSLPSELLAALPPAAKDQLDHMRRERAAERDEGAPSHARKTDTEGVPPPDEPPDGSPPRGKLRLIK